MAIPKNKCRLIIVNNVLYEYCVTGFINIFIKNTVTKKTCKKVFDVKPKWKKQIHPSDIKSLIIESKI
jgi:hypothetical protein